MMVVQGSPCLKIGTPDLYETRSARISPHSMVWVLGAEDRFRFVICASSLISMQRHWRTFYSGHLSREDREASARAMPAQCRVPSALDMRRSARPAALSIQTVPVPRLPCPAN